MMFLTCISLLLLFVFVAGRRFSLLFDIIVRWFLKMVDGILLISPHIVIIDPNHGWFCFAGLLAKTLA
jgi:integral membrane sensor domain MASE1